MRNTFSYLSELNRLARTARRSWEPGDVDHQAGERLAEWVTEADSQEEAIRRIYSVASGDLYNADETLAYDLEAEWAVEHGMTEQETREALYDRELRREGERHLYGTA